MCVSLHIRMKLSEAWKCSFKTFKLKSFEALWKSFFNLKKLCVLANEQRNLGGQTHESLSWQQELVPPHRRRSTKLALHSEEEKLGEKVSTLLVTRKKIRLQILSTVCSFQSKSTL